MKWLRRAIPSAANLGPDTDSSFRSRDPPLFPARVYVPAIWSRLYPVPVRRSGYVEPPLPGAGLSFRFCAGVLSRPIAGLRERRAGLHREPVVVCVRCCRTFRAVCSGADMENRFEKAGRARSSGWNVEEKGRVRDESAEQRRGKTCGVRCCRSDAIQPHNYWLLRNPDKASGRNGVRSYSPSGFSARHPFGRKSLAS